MKFNDSQNAFCFSLYREFLASLPLTHTFDHLHHPNFHPQQQPSFDLASTTSCLCPPTTLPFYPPPSKNSPSALLMQSLTKVHLSDSPATMTSNPETPKKPSANRVAKPVTPKKSPGKSFATETNLRYIWMCVHHNKNNKVSLTLHSSHVSY